MLLELQLKNMIVHEEGSVHGLRILSTNIVIPQALVSSIEDNQRVRLHTGDFAFRSIAQGRTLEFEWHDGTMQREVLHHFALPKELVREIRFVDVDGWAEQLVR